jgi:hypothetical protein
VSGIQEKWTRAKRDKGSRRQKGAAIEQRRGADRKDPTIHDPRRRFLEE